MSLISQSLYDFSQPDFHHAIGLHNQMALLQPHYHLNNNKDNPEMNLSKTICERMQFITSFDDWLSLSTIAVTRPIAFTSTEV